MTIGYIINDLKKMYLKSLKKECNDENINDSLILQELEMIITNSSDTNTLTETENLVYTEDYIYKKEWNKLHNTHKIIKLREFVNKLNISNNSQKDNLKKDLIKLVKEKKLTKKEAVNYNSKKGLISSIPNLKFVNNKYEINFNNQ
jgi:hypothetical protein